MLMLLDQMDKSYYTPRVYVVAETDKLSGRRALDREAAKVGLQLLSLRLSCWDQPLGGCMQARGGLEAA
jgi:hypothetical protein